jgi:cytochrome c oxidase assembly protein subunit 15
LRGNSQLLLAMVSLQFTLGVLNVVLALPLTVAVMHNAGAALTLAVLLSLLDKTTARTS